VDDEDTVTEMFNQEVIKMHTYYIPNSRVTAFQASEDLVKAADQIAKEKNGLAKPAINLITFNKEVSRAMGYVFGNFVIHYI
jgi:structural maintenance of chromosome 2